MRLLIFSSVISFKDLCVQFGKLRASSYVPYVSALFHFPFVVRNFKNIYCNVLIGMDI